MTPLAVSSSLTHRCGCTCVLRPCHRRPWLSLTITSVTGQDTAPRCAMLGVSRTAR